MTQGAGVGGYESMHGTEGTEDEEFGTMKSPNVEGEGHGVSTPVVCTNS